MNTKIYLQTYCLLLSSYLLEVTVRVQFLDYVNFVFRTKIIPIMLEDSPLEVINLMSYYNGLLR